MSTKSEENKKAVSSKNAFARMREFFVSPQSPQDEKKLKSTLKWLILGRVTILTGLLVFSSWGALTNSNKWTHSQLIFVAIGVTFGLSIINTLWLRWSKRLSLLAYIQLFTDVALSTFVIYLTGGSLSPFVFLYLIIIPIAALVISSHGAVIVSSWSGFCYAILVSGIIPSFHGVDIQASAQEILSVYLSLVIIGVLSAYIAKQAEAFKGLARRREKQFHELSHHQRQLFNDLSEGIITLDLGNVVTSINRSAASILGLSVSDAERIVGRSLQSIMSHVGVDDIDSIVARARKSGKKSDLGMKSSQGDGELWIRYSVRELINNEGKETGSIMLFDDISHMRNMENRLSLHEEMTKLLADEPAPSSQDFNNVVQQVKLIGDSAVMGQVLSLVERVANSDASVLITGESGTGKELIAKAIHYGGPRSQKPFVAINCGAIPENLIESELFGHKKGAYTGAHRDQPGLFRQANGGTIFLDEIGELPLQLQTKLLRVLQEKTVRAVGDVHDFAVDVRVIAATNRDLKSEIQADKFREDLFYRLNVVNIMLPPLRERKSDVPQLVRYFIGQFADPAKVLPQVSPEALDLLMAHTFPGNIRELENIIERALVLGGQAILPEHLPDEVKRRTVSSPSSNGHAEENFEQTEIITLPMDLEEALAGLEQQCLVRALEESGGVKKQAAQLLGLNFRSFRYRLKKYGLSDADARDE